MPFTNGVTSVGTTAVAIGTPGAVPDNIGILVQNLGSVTVYLGSSTVSAGTTATGGLQVAANAIVNVPCTRGLRGDVVRDNREFHGQRRDVVSGLTPELLGAGWLGVWRPP